MAHDIRPLHFEAGSLNGISGDQITNHHGKKYAGYVGKLNEIETVLADETKADRGAANASYSIYRELKREEPFSHNGIILHELYFGNLGGNGQLDANSAFGKQVIQDFGSIDKYAAEIAAVGKSGRGWAVTALSLLDNKLHIYLMDLHDIGAVFYTWPVMVLDVYEHAYYIDYKNDTAAYIGAFLKNVDWSIVNKRFELAQQMFAGKDTSALLAETARVS